jgi:thiol-disulfide isomerase/thioredoxin
MTGVTRTPIALLILAVIATGTAGAADIRTISHGRKITLEDHLVPGKYVLFDFYADWCGPCKVIEPRIAELAGRNSRLLAVRKVDVVNWDSAVARQHRLSSIPYLVLYGPDGDRLAAGDAASVLRRLTREIGADPGGSASGGDRSPAPRFRRRAATALIVLVVAIAAALFGLVASRRRPAPGSRPPAFVPPARTDTAANPGDPAIWFTMVQASLEGPFTRAQLAELVSSGDVAANAAVRRRGDNDWRTLDDILD